MSDVTEMPARASEPNSLSTAADARTRLQGIKATLTEKGQSLTTSMGTVLKLLDEYIPTLNGQDEVEKAVAELEKTVEIECPEGCIADRLEAINCKVADSVAERALANSFCELIEFALAVPDAQLRSRFEALLHKAANYQPGDEYFSDAALLKMRICA